MPKSMHEIYSRLFHHLKMISLLIGLAISSSPAVSNCLGHKIYESQTFTLHISRLNSGIINGVISAYRASNQRLTLELCLENKSPTKKRALLSTCASSNCSDDSPIDVSHITPWYRDGNSTRSVFPSREVDQVLIPELFIKNPLLIKNDNSKKVSRILTKTEEGTRYISTQEYESMGNKDKHGRIKHDASTLYVSDSETINAIDIEKFGVFVLKQKNEENLDPITINVLFDDKLHTVKIPVHTFPFYLDESEISNSIYYRSLLSRSPKTLSSELKDIHQLSRELEDIKSKGILYPTAYIYDDYREYMQIRNKIGFKNDKIFLFDGILIEHRIRKDWIGYKRRMQKIVNDPIFSQYSRIYFYLADEPDKSDYERLMRNAYPIAKEVGAGIFLAGHASKILNTIYPGTVYVVAYEPSSKIADQVHSKGASIYSYANPQIGIYKPSDIRLNYGLKIFTNNYDGIMPYAYQHSSGSQWSDQDGDYREHMLSYPTSNGILETIQGLSLENAILDQRYFTTYKRITNASTSPTSDCHEDKNLLEEIFNAKPNHLDDLRFRLAIAISTCLGMQPRPPTIH